MGNRLPRSFQEAWDQPRGFVGFLATIDNIPISIRYMVTSFGFFILGGILALLMRLQLARPENGLVSADTYNQLFTMHGTTMMFLFVIPFIEALANYLIPLLNGTRDLPFPRLTCLAYWTYLFGGLFLYSSWFFGLAPDGGWFAYLPLNAYEFSPSLRMDFWDIALSVAEVAAIGAAAEMIVGILRHRAPGMSLNRMPMFSWAMLVTAIMIVFAFTVLVVGTLMLELDRKGLTAFFDATRGGDPLLWQHLFWTFGHPEVYIMFLPAVGIMSHVVQTFTRRPLVSYPLMVFALVATGLLSFGLWVHHMYTTGISTVALGFFAAVGAVVAIPSGINVFGWIATIWTGRPVWRTPLLFAVAAIILLTIGGVSGVMVALVPFDLQAHDTYFIVAHLHYVLFGGSIFPIFAGLYLWYPKFSGRLPSPRLGAWSAGLMFLGFNLAFGPMHWSGLLGMPRRVYTYLPGLGWDDYNLVSTVGALVLALGVLLTVVNFLVSLRRGETAGPDPWHGDSLEWSEASPPANAQFARLPVVRSRHPCWTQTTLRPVPTDDPALARCADAFDRWPTRWRGSLIVRPMDGSPVGVAHLPRRSIWPFVVAVGFLLLFVSALTEVLLLLAGGILVTLTGLAGWFWPVDTEKVAIEEDRAGMPVPLAIGNRDANGYWGTRVLVLILGTASATFITCYFYLGEGLRTLPASFTPPPLTWALAATGVAVLVVAITWWIRRQLSRGRSPRGSQLAGLTAQVALVVTAVQAWRSTGFDPGSSGFASGVLGVHGFGWAISAGTAVMMAVGLLWSWRAGDDPRGRGVAWNASLVSYFTAVNWVAAVLVLYAWPRIT